MTLDIAIIAVYLLAMLGIGLYYRRAAQTSLESFFLAGRNVPGWLNGVSYTAAMVSTDAATAYGGLAVATGAFVCWWYLSRFGLALFIGAVLFACFWRRLGLFTSLEFYELRFSGRAAAFMRFWIAMRTALIAIPAWTGITLLAACKIMQPVLGLEKWQTLALVVPISFAYILLSGYRGVVVSNFIQMVIFFAGTLALAVLTLHHLGGPAGLAGQLRALGPGGEEMLRLIPPTGHDVFPLAAAIAWLIGQTVGYGGDAAPMAGAMEGQRILSSRSPREAAAMYVVTALTLFTLLLLVSLPCLAAAVWWPELRAPGADRELAYGLLMKKLLPAGFSGLVIAAMLAGVMSTVADNLNFGSQVLVNDLYRRWVRPGQSERAYLWAGKLALLLLLGMAIAVVYNATIIFDVAVFMLQLSSAELPANWAQWWWWRFNSRARLAASFGGAAIFCLVVLAPKLLVRLGLGWADALIIPWWWQTFLVMGLTTVLWVSVALLTPPDSPAVLEHFYRRARPLGSWGPVRQRLAVSTCTASDRNRPKPEYRLLGGGFALAGIGFAAACCLILGLSTAYLGDLRAAGLLAAAAVLFFVFARRLRAYFAALEDRNSDSPNHD
jgi:SSS family solute:Na+ symporter